MADSGSPSLEEALATLASCLRGYYPGRSPIRLTVAFDDGEELRMPWPATVGATPSCTHSADYRQVLWYGVSQRFTSAQAKVVQLLWEARERGLPEVSGAVLLEAAESTSGKLSDLFKGHPAWGSMIGQAGKGIYQLYSPEEH